MYFTSKIDSVLLVGTGGHCRVIIDTLRRIDSEIKIGLVTKERDMSFTLDGVPSLGCDEDLDKLFIQGYKYAFISVGSIKSTSHREKLENKLKTIGYTLPVIVDPTATVSKSAALGAGTFVAAGAIINAGASIGDCCIVNTGAIIEHECEIGSFSHISPAAVLLGGVKVGRSSHVGAKCVIRQGLTVGKESVLGIGSVVTKDIPDGVIAYGVPCEIKGKNI